MVSGPFTAWDLAQPQLRGLFSESVLALVSPGSPADLSCFPLCPTARLSMGYVKLEPVSFLQTTGATFNRSQRTEGETGEPRAAFGVNFYRTYDLYPSV